MEKGGVSLPVCTRVAFCLAAADMIVAAVLPFVTDDYVNLCHPKAFGIGYAVNLPPAPIIILALQFIVYPKLKALETAQYHQLDTAEPIRPQPQDGSQGPGSKLAQV